MKTKEGNKQIFRSDGSEGSIRERGREGRGGGVGVERVNMKDNAGNRTKRGGRKDIM